MPAVAIPLAYYAAAAVVTAIAAQYAWQQSGAAEKTAKAVDNMIANMSSAEEEAQAKSKTGTVADTCSTCQPPGCDDKNKKIDERVEELKIRHRDMVEDTNNLFYHHYFTSQAHPQLGSYQGHQQQFDAKQKNLRKQINDARQAGCTVTNPDAEEWATNSAPQSPKYKYPTPPPL